MFTAAVYKLWPTCFCIQSFIRTRSCRFVYIWSVVTFVWQWENQIVATETMWPTKLKICTLWPLSEKVCSLLEKSFGSPFQTEIIPIATTERKASILLLSLLYTQWIMVLIRKCITVIQYLFKGVDERQGKEKNIHFFLKKDIEWSVMLDFHSKKNLCLKISP